MKTLIINNWLCGAGRRLLLMVVLFTVHSSLFVSEAQAQTIGEAFYIYRNDGQFNAFFRDEVDSIAYSYYDADSIRYDEIVTQLVYTQDSLYRIPIAAIDSVAFGVNEIKLSEAYVPFDHDGYVVEEADTIGGNYLLRFLGGIPQLGTGDIISIVNDTLAVHARISKMDYLDGSRVRIVSEKARLDEIFTGGSFTLSTETAEAASVSRRNHVYHPVAITYYDTDNQRRKIRRAGLRLYEKTIDYSGTDIYKTDYTRLYLETCRFDFNLDLVVTCNFSSKQEAVDKYSHGELELTKAVIRGNINTDFMLRFDASAKKKDDFEEMMLKRNVHKPIEATFIVAGVPIMVTMDTHLLMDGNYDLEGAFSAYAGFGTSTTAELGFSWSQAKGLRPYASFNSNFDLHKPTIEGKAHLETKVSVFPRVTFSLYGLIGPSFDIKPYLHPVLDIGFYDQMGSNKQDYYGAECDIFTGYDAAVGLTFLSATGRKPFVHSPSWNVVDKMILESPKKIKFEKGTPENLTPNKPMEVSFKVTEHDWIFDRDMDVELPFTVKFETNSGKLNSDFVNVDTSTGLATVEWTPASETTDGKDAYIVAMMHTPDGQVKTADRWTPEKEELCPDENHPHWIDLGLPSGTKWRCCNEGASTPEAYGGYYTFGQISSAPSLDQIQELINYTTYEWTTQNSVYGGKFTGSNGGSVFLPAAGYRSSNVTFSGACYYWSSTTDNELNGYMLCLVWKNYINAQPWNNDYKMSVRPVR